jgi:hypothetical protein
MFNLLNENLDQFLTGVIVNQKFISKNYKVSCAYIMSIFVDLVSL